MSSILSLLLCCFYPKTLNKSVFIEDTCESLTSDCKHESVHLDEEPIRRELEMLPYENDFSFVTETKDFDQMTSGDCEYFELLSRQYLSTPEPCEYEAEADDAIPLVEVWDRKTVEENECYTQHCLSDNSALTALYYSTAELKDLVLNHFDHAYLHHDSDESMVEVWDKEADELLRYRLWLEWNSQSSVDSSATDNTPAFFSPVRVGDCSTTKTFAPMVTSTPKRTPNSRKRPRHSRGL